MTARTAHRGIVHELEAHNTAFSLWFIGIFTLSFVFLYTIDVVPDPSAHWNNEHNGVAIASAATNDVQPTKPTQGRLPDQGVGADNLSTNAQAQMPVRIVVDSINLDATIGNPQTTDDAVLNQFLKSGAVRYPTSAQLGMDGTVVLFGHSSYLPVVANQAYKTFDGIQNLVSGDEISVYSNDREYRYEVMSVTRVHASNGTVALKTDDQYLTLVTCDSFNKNLSDRWVVESKLVGIYSHSS